MIANEADFFMGPFKSLADVHNKYRSFSLRNRAGRAGDRFEFFTNFRRVILMLKFELKSISNLGVGRIVHPDQTDRLKFLRDHEYR
jgi:hypothetical protein